MFLPSFEHTQKHSSSRLLITGMCCACDNKLYRTYSCYCIDGYTGKQCQTNWDECWSMPCLNGGTCIDGVAAYNCTCPEGFSGKYLSV